MPTTNRTPTLAEVIRSAVERRLMDVYVSMPGVIQSYNPVTQTATVQPLLRKTGPDPTGTDRVNALPPLQGVPVCFFGSGSWRITVPVSVGDQCLLIWSDRALDRWKSLAPASYSPDKSPGPNNGTTSIDPQAGNLHHLTDAIAILGLVPPALPRLATQTDRLSMGQDGGQAVEVMPARINLGVGASQAVVLGGQYSTHMTALSSALSSLSTAANALGLAITPLMLPPAAAAAKAAQVAAVAALTNAITAVNNLANDISATSFTVP